MFPFRPCGREALGTLAKAMLLRIPYFFINNNTVIGMQSPLAACLVCDERPSTDGKDLVVTQILGRQDAKPSAESPDGTAR
jgi:hypothetical protein